MTALNEDDAGAEDTRKAAFRVRHVGTKLNAEELRGFESLVEHRGTTQAELIRDLILEEIAKGTTTTRKPDPVLTEIVGVRLLLVNLLQPRDQHDPLTKDNFEALLGEIKRVKKQVALGIEQENGRR
jgi:hypothetical protein